MTALKVPGMDIGHAALRRGRHSIRGQTYLVTFTTARRIPHFRSAALAFDACRFLVDPELWQRSRLLAWVLMPDHWHGLIQISANESLGQCIGRLKGRTARQIGRLHPDVRPLWASAYHERAIRRDEDLAVAARYLVMNPVRAGLVERPGAYPFWDAVWIDGSCRG